MNTPMDICSFFMVLEIIFVKVMFYSIHYTNSSFFIIERKSKKWKKIEEEKGKRITPLRVPDAYKLILHPPTQLSPNAPF